MVCHEKIPSNRNLYEAQALAKLDAASKAGVLAQHLSFPVYFAIIG
jgi:hypothetical protein